ncbi:PTS fructose transporter subunit IIB [Liquorilactobacillus satsumensis]|nr:fructose PTS transporter subunit IIB [Liquorilactobacillus satsumensis]MCP9311684.1 PTS fructose transporter subunit IIB [Liquorilactobacillus satsumensis]MCP9358817.1 PTS fructose transporter subunit IIB [Liquorilactobacillus satsumensis]
MKIVGVSACTVGIAHTYLAQQKMEDAAKKLGDEIKIETQGTIGIENKLSANDIKEADIVILAIDVKISGEERFENKKKVKVSTETAIKSPNKLIAKLHEIAGKQILNGKARG